MRATIKDVAKLAGVSVSTVSLVLNNKSVPITDKTKETVFSAAKELQYRPNQLAVGLVSRKTNSLGLIIPDSSNPFFASLSNQIEKRANVQNYTVIVGNTSNNAKSTCNYLRVFADHGVDGIILAQSDFGSTEETQQCFDLVHDLKIPVIMVDRVYNQDNVNSVIVDQELAGYLATRHLLNLGHTRIGCASGPVWLNNCQQRLNGYKKALAEYGVEFDENLIFSDNLDIECGIHALPVLLGEGTTAIFAFNDLIAYGIYKELANYNLSVPNDLSVVGMDDVFFSEVIQPPLTTVSQPVSQIAKLVVNNIIDQIEGSNPKSSEPVILKPILKVRGSTKHI